MILTKRQLALFRGNGSGPIPNARSIADSVITALSPAAWYRNATGVTEAGGFASQWDDYSGNARHLIQAVGTNQPAYANGIFTFDGADNFMAASTWAQTQPETIYLVVNQVSWASSDNFFDGATALSAMLYQITATPNIQLYAGANAAGNTGLAVGSYGVVCAVFNGASSVLRVNNSADTTGNPGAGNMGGFTLGARPTPSNYANIAVKEAIVFAAAHSDAQRTSVIAALNNALTVF